MQVINHIVSQWHHYRKSWKLLFNLDYHVWGRLPSRVAGGSGGASFLAGGPGDAVADGLVVQLDVQAVDGVVGFVHGGVELALGIVARRVEPLAAKVEEPRNSGVRASFSRGGRLRRRGEFWCRRNSGVRVSFRVADDHDGAAHGRCRGDGK